MPGSLIAECAAEVHFWKAWAISGVAFRSRVASGPPGLEAESRPRASPRNDDTTSLDRLDRPADSGAVMGGRPAFRGGSGLR